MLHYTNYTAAFAPGQGVTDGLVYELRIDEGQGSLLRERALEQHSALSYGSWSYVPNPRLSQLGSSALTQTVFCQGGYRFGFNGMHRDDEIAGRGNALDFGARLYDSRLGRFLSLDPIGTSMSEMSPFHFAFNSPNQFIDENGLNGRRPRSGSNAGQTVVNNNPPRDRRHVEMYNPPSQRKLPVNIMLFEPPKSPGGSNSTDPLITNGNRSGQMSSLGIELTDAVVTRIKDQRSFVSHGSTTYTTETNYNVRFRSSHNAELFAQMQSIYEAKVRQAIKDIPAPGAPDTYESQDAYNLATATYRFQVARAKASLGPSPMQQLLSQTIDNPGRQDFVTERSEELPEIRQGNPPTAE